MCQKCILIQVLYEIYEVENSSKIVTTNTILELGQLDWVRFIQYK